MQVCYFIALSVCSTHTVAAKKTVTFQFRSVPSRQKQNGRSVHKKWKWDGAGDDDGQAMDVLLTIPIVVSTKRRLESLRRPKEALLYPSDHIWGRSESINSVRSIDHQ